MMLETLLGVMRSADGARDRSKQRRLGPSSVNGCDRQAWLRMVGAPAVNEEEPLRGAAMLGTAIHRHIEEAFRREDPWGDRYEIEVEVDEIGVLGHADLYDRQERAVWDWKTITRAKAGSFPTRGQILQVMIYGRLLIESGRPVDRVGLIGITRDGSEADWVEWSADYDGALADEGLARLLAIQEAEEPPAPQMDPVSFCRSYCEFYGEGSCLGKAAAGADDPVLPAEGLTQARAYLQAKAEADAANSRAEAARAALEGIAGSADGIRVSWAARSSSTVDRDAIKAALGEVPMKPGRESIVLTVKAVNA